MHKYIKTGLLIVVLVVPVLIFVFLQGYTTNHFDLPYYVPLQDPVTHEVVVENGDTAFYQIDDFSLFSIDSTRTITAAQLKNKLIVVNAFKGPYNRGDEKVLSQLTRISALHEAYPALTILTILSNQDTARTNRIAPLQRQGWLVASVPEDAYDYTLQTIFHLGTPDPKKTISDYSSFSLIDRNGFIRGYYDARHDEETERLLAEIRVLEYKNKTEQK